MLIQGYEDSNDVFHLQHDPLNKDILDGIWLLNQHYLV